MCVNERELLYLFSTITQSLAAMLGIGIIAVAYINEKRKSIETRLWDLTSCYWQKVNLPTSELSTRGIKTVDQLLEFLRQKDKSIKDRDATLYSQISKARAEYETQPKIVKRLIYSCFLFAVIGIVCSSVGLIFTSELGNTCLGFISALVIVSFFILATLFFAMLIFKAILPMIKTK